jgi:hypothetical protein
VSVGLCIPLSLLGNYYLKMFLRQRRIGGGVVFCAFGVVSKESKGLVLPTIVVACLTTPSTSLII